MRNGNLITGISQGDSKKTILTKSLIHKSSPSRILGVSFTFESRYKVLGFHFMTKLVWNFLRVGSIHNILGHSELVGFLHSQTCRLSSFTSKVNHNYRCFRVSIPQRSQVQGSFIHSLTSESFGSFRVCIHNYCHLRTTIGLDLDLDGLIWWPLLIGSLKHPESIHPWVGQRKTKPAELKAQSSMGRGHELV